MKFSKDIHNTGAALLAGLFTLTLTATAFSAENAPQKTQVLLDQVKKSELDREVAAKQTSIDRLKEDLDRNKKDAEGLQKTINTTSDLVNDSTKRYEELTAERKRLQHDLNLTLARIDAEGEKIDGLRNLTAAQGKSLNALTRHIEETEVRTQLRAAEMQAIAEGKLAPGDDTEDKRHPELVKLRKALSIAEAKTASEEKLARGAMKSAASKVQVADLAAARVQRMADETGAEKTDAAPKEVAPKEIAPKKPVVNAPTTQKPMVVKEAPKSNRPPAPIGERPVDMKNTTLTR